MGTNKKYLFWDELSCEPYLFCARQRVGITDKRLCQWRHSTLLWYHHHLLNEILISTSPSSLLVHLISDSKLLQLYIGAKFEHCRLFKAQLRLCPSLTRILTHRQLQTQFWKLTFPNKTHFIGPFRFFKASKVELSYFT